MAKPGRPDVAGEQWWLDSLRVAAPVSILAGAVGSVGLMLWTGRHNESLLLLMLFALWVLSPFVALILASFFAKSWSAISQSMLHGAILFLTLFSLFSRTHSRCGRLRPRSAASGGSSSRIADSQAFDTRFVEGPFAHYSERRGLHAAGSLPSGGHENGCVS